MLSNYSTVADTPEIQRIKTTQQNISAVCSHYFFSVATLKFCVVRRVFFPHCLIFLLHCLYFLSNVSLVL